VFGQVRLQTRRSVDHIVRVFLPRRVPHGMDRRRPEAGLDRGHDMAAQDFSDIRGKKVMVIDDSNTIRRSAEIFLNQAGCQVILAQDGFEALSKINDHQPNIIFCDILMPRLDGYQTCALIKRSPRFHKTPVVMLSSKDGLFDRARGRMVGSSEYLTKPFTKDSLLTAVRQHSMN
jgi:twitching motility two-component system response regulator PilG